MLFLPCAFAFFGGRDPKSSEESVLSPACDPLLDTIGTTRAVQAFSPSEEAAAAQPLIDIPKRPGKPAEIAATNLTDTSFPNRMQKNHQARILRSEMEALVASAAAARAQAEALAAQARLAAAKAEAADADAIEAEAAAEAAIQKIRRAA
jgi:hypothetical protein